MPTKPFLPSPLFHALLAVGFSLGGPLAQAASPQVQVGLYHSVHVDEKGQLWKWGTTFHRCPAITTGQWVSGAGPERLVDKVSNAAASFTNTYAIREDGSLGYFYLSSENLFTPIEGTYRSVSGAFSHWAGVRTDGTIWSEGNNESGQLGNGTTTSSSGIAQASGSGYTQVSRGANHVLALKQDGSAWAWGSNEKGELGLGTMPNPSSLPSSIPGRYAAVAAGDATSYLIDTNGKLWAVGNNAEGYLGLGHKQAVITPTLIGSGYQAVYPGATHTLALKTDGSLWAWGSNTAGQLGLGHTDAQLTPVKVGDGYVTAGVGNGVSVAVKSDGSVWAWGSNQCGELGTASKNPKMETSPVLVPIPQTAAVSPSGDAKDFSLSVLLPRWSQDTNQPVKVYIAAFLPDGGILMREGKQWVPFRKPIPIAFDEPASYDSIKISVLEHMDVSQVPRGTRVAVGYGQTEQDMLNGKYQFVHTLR